MADMAAPTAAAAVVVGFVAHSCTSELTGAMSHRYLPQLKY